MNTLLEEDQLNSAHDHCHVCGSGSFSEAGIVLQLQSRPDVFMKECPACYAASADRMPVESYLKTLYDPKVYESSLIHEDTLSEKCARNILDYYDPGKQTVINILDYGGGNGNLARHLIVMLKNRYEQLEDVTATIVDIYPQDDSSELHYISVDEFMDTGKRFDIVIASAVLEHIPDLNPVLDRLLDAGKPGALFYSRTPYDLPLAKYAPFYPVKWPRHVHDMGPRFWQQLAKNRSLEILQSRTSIVETSFNSKPLVSVLSHLLKLPSRIETRIFSKCHQAGFIMWRFVGGWEVYIRLPGYNTL